MHGRCIFHKLLPESRWLHVSAMMADHHSRPEPTVNQATEFPPRRQIDE